MEMTDRIAKNIKMTHVDMLENEVTYAEGRARGRVMLKVIEECMWHDIKNEVYDNVNNHPRMVQYFTKWNELQEEQPLSEHGRNAVAMYITINPQVDDLEALQDCIDSLIKGVWCNKMI